MITQSSIYILGLHLLFCFNIKIKAKSFTFTTGLNSQWQDSKMLLWSNFVSLVTHNGSNERTCVLSNIWIRISQIQLGSKHIYHWLHETKMAQERRDISSVQYHSNVLGNPTEYGIQIIISLQSHCRNNNFSQTTTTIQSPEKMWKQIFQHDLLPRLSWVVKINFPP